MNFFRENPETRTIKEATATAQRAVARGAVPPAAIDNYVAVLAMTIDRYRARPNGARPSDGELRAATVALERAQGNRLVAEKLTAFCGAYGAMTGATDLTRELAFRAAVIQGFEIIRYTANAH